MAKTSYRECWWLIQAVEGEFGSGSYRKGTGYSLRNLNDLRPMGSRIDWITTHGYDTYVDEDVLRSKDQFRQTLMRWRTLIYNEFGLAIIMESTSGPDKKGGGGYYYYLANPELLDDAGKTLREHIEFLAESEKNREDWISLPKMTERFTGGSSSMGFLSSGGSSSYGYLSKEGTSYRTVLGEENLELIQFAMQFGEVLTIKYGKVSAGVHINAPYSLEPYQLKEIEGRWYVIGNLFPLGHKEKAELAVYDLARLQFADEENPDVLYEPVKGFDIWEHVAIDYALKKLMGKVVPVDLFTKTEEFTDYLSNHPFCSAQEALDKGEFRIYICLTYDLLIQLGAYGKELSIGLPRKEEEKDDRSLIRMLLNTLRKVDEWRD